MNTPIKLQHDKDNFWAVIMFKMCYHPLDLELVHKVITVKQRSTSNLSETMIWRTSLYNTTQVLYEELSSSQERRLWASMKVQTRSTSNNTGRVIVFTRYCQTSPTASHMPHRQQYPSSITGWGVKWYKIFPIFSYSSSTSTFLITPLPRPCWLVGRPCWLVGRPCWLVGRPCWLVGRPCSMVGRPCSMVGRPCWLVGRPCWLVGRPCSLVGRPCSLVGRPCSAKYTHGMCIIMLHYM